MSLYESDKQHCVYMSLYESDKLYRVCVQDSDRLWRLTPPAQKALEALLDDSSAAMSFSWSVLRNAPPLSPHGSPMCQATQTFQLAPRTRTELVDILEVHCCCFSAYPCSLDMFRCGLGLPFCRALPCGVALC